MAIVEVCGFNDWYVDLLQEMGCREVILVQPEESSSRKTDRRDAAKLSEQLWINRQRIAEGKRIQGLRRVILGAISKEGSKLVRFILGLMVTQVVRRDAWMRSFYRRIKRRRGAKIARVAVMRRLCTVIYRMLQTHEPYALGGPTEVLQQRKLINFVHSPSPAASGTQEENGSMTKEVAMASS